MNKYYSILGIGLLSSMALTSCKQDMLDGMDKENPYYEIHDYTINASISGEKDNSSRANIDSDGKSFIWNKSDKITIWNGNQGYTFNIASQYDETKFSSASVPFYYDGETSPWEGTATIWGIYPEVTEENENITAEGNTFTFKLNDPIALEDGENDNKPHLKNTIYMLGKGEVTGKDANNITFEHLTSMFMFKLNNFRDENITLKSLNIAADAAVFSKVLTVTDGAKTYSESVNNITVNFGNNGFNMEAGENIESFINVFPTTSMTAQTKLTFTVTYTHGTEASELEQVLKEGTVGDLFNGQPLVTEDNCQFVSGKRYIINLRPELPADERGYKEYEQGKFSISTGNGLYNFVKYESDRIADAGIYVKIDDAATTLDMSGIDFISIASFAGTFDGNGKTISNLGAPMFIENTGIIKNMKLDNVSITANLNSSIDTENVTAALATANKGTIEGVSAKASITASGNSASGYVGGLVSINSGTISGCSILNGTEITNGNNSKMNIGGLVCTNTGTIIGSSVENGVIINHSGATGVTIGGLVALFQNGSLIGSSASANIRINNTSDFFIGGLAGDAYQGELYIIGCYSAGSIHKTVGGTGTVKIGGLICRGTWEWGACKLNITGCYTSTDIKDFSNGISGFAIANGFIGSYSLVKENSELNTIECYWYNLAENDTQLSTDGTQKYDIPGVEKTNSADDIKTHMSAMNSVIVETGFEYVTGDSNAPLKIKPAEPGFGGPDFGDGDELN